MKPPVRTLLTCLLAGAVLAACATTRPPAEVTPVAPAAAEESDTVETAPEPTPTVDPEPFAPASEPDPVRRKAAVLRAEDRRVVDDALRSAVRDTLPEIRVLAIRALGRIGDSDARSTLERALRDPDEAVRAAAAYSIGLLRDPDGVAALAELVQDPRARVRSAVAAALGLIDSGEVEAPLLSLIRDEAASVARAACATVPLLRDPRFAVDALLERSAGNDAVVALAATDTLSRLAARPGWVDAGQKQEIRQHLIRTMRTPIPEWRMLVARGLAIPYGTEEIEALALLVEDPDPRVRATAVTSFSFPGAPVDPFLRKTLEDPDGRVVLATVEGLSRLADPTAAEAMADIIVRDERQWLRVTAVRSLRAIDADRAAALANGLSRAESPAIRRETAGLLAGRGDESSVEYLRRLLDDEDPGVRAAATAAAAAVPGPLSAVLEARIEETSAVMRAAVARAAGSRLESGTSDEEQRTDAYDLLDRVWQSATESGQFQVQRRVIEAARRGPAGPRARALFERGLGSRDWRVRREAIAGLEQRFGEDRSESLGSATERPLEDYVEIVRWAERPRAAVVTIERPGFLPGRFTVRLATAEAPLTAREFARRAESGFYDGVPFTRLRVNSRILHGDPTDAAVEAWLRPEYYPHPYAAGTLATASGGAHGAAIEWFVTLGPQPNLAGRLTPFGHVVQNYPGVASLLLPGDHVVSIRIYEGDGTEPLPKLDDQPDAARTSS